jgi:DNA-binding winged helix-turn-helix (wHTH) protein
VFQIALLGPLEVRRDGQRVHVAGGRASELLVRLALEAGAVVRADRLIDDLWAAGARSTRRNTLQSKVAMLRRGLGDPEVITNRDGGYALAVQPSYSRWLEEFPAIGHASLTTSAPAVVPSRISATVSFPPSTVARSTPARGSRHLCRAGLADTLASYQDKGPVLLER